MKPPATPSSPFHELLQLDRAVHERIRKLPGTKLWNLLGPNHQPTFLPWRAVEGPVDTSSQWIATPADPMGLLRIALDICQQSGLRAKACSLSEGADGWTASASALRPDTRTWSCTEFVLRADGVDSFGGATLACVRVLSRAWSDARSRGWRGVWDDAIPPVW